MCIWGKGWDAGRVGSDFWRQSRVWSGRVNVSPGRVGGKKSDPWTTLVLCVLHGCGRSYSPLPCGWFPRTGVWGMPGFIGLPPPKYELTNHVNLFFRVIFKPDKTQIPSIERPHTSRNVYDRLQTSTNVYERLRTSTNVYERRRMSMRWQTSTNVYDRLQTSTNVYERLRMSTNVYDRQRTSTNVYDRQRTSIAVNEHSSSVRSRAFSASCTDLTFSWFFGIPGFSSISRASKIFLTAQKQWKPVRSIVCTRESAHIWNALWPEHHRIEQRSEHHRINMRSALCRKSTFWISTSTSSAGAGTIRRPVTTRVSLSRNYTGLLSQGHQGRLQLTHYSSLICLWFVYMFILCACLYNYYLSNEIICK